MRKLLAAAAALFCAAATPAAADVLVDNVNGYTLGAEGRLIRFNAMLVGDDGRVQRLYARGEKKAERARFRFDGKGRTLMPGLIDAHGHVMGLGLGAIQLDLSGTRSLQEAQAKIAAYAAANPSPRWIIGRGWNQETWGLGRFPTAADLDAVVRDRPVWLERVDGHAGWANSAAMKEAGITAKTASPAGGKIEKGAGGQPNGIFIDAASDLVNKAVPGPLPRVRDQALQRAQALMLASGLTAVADMGTSSEDWLTMRRAGDANTLKVRIMSYAGGLEPLLEVAGTGPTPWLYDGRLRMGGVKLYSDGALGSRGAWLKQPYKDSPKERGLGFLDDTELRNMMSRAAMDGFQVAVHAIGDAANAQLLRAIDELAAPTKAIRRWRDRACPDRRSADFRLLRPERHHRLDAARPPDQRLEDGRGRMGMERLGAPTPGARCSRRACRSRSAPTSGRASNPFSRPRRRDQPRGSGQDLPPGGWMPGRRLTAGAGAASGLTKACAPMPAFAEDRIGTLERGKLPTSVLIDRDIFAAATPQQIRDTKVLETWLGGVKAWPE
jgi:predicted amidohydrolase YtcJ